MRSYSAYILLSAILSSTPNLCSLYFYPFKFNSDGALMYEKVCIARFLSGEVIQVAFAVCWPVSALVYWLALEPYGLEDLVGTLNIFVQNLEYILSLLKNI